MSFLLKLIAYPLLLIVFLIVFFPTKYAYYHLQHKLYDDFKLTLQHKHIQDKPLDFEIQNLEIGLNGERIATLGELTLQTYIYANTLSVSKVYVDDSLAPEYLKNLQEIVVTYELKDPLHINIKINSPIFVKGNVYFDTEQMSIIFTLYVKPSQIYQVKDIAKFFKSARRGVYIYEYKF